MRTFRSGGLAVAALLGIACGRSVQESSEDQMGVTVNGLGTRVATVVITVEAADIQQPLVFNLVLQNGIATGTIRIPPGTNRTVSALAFESDGAIAYEGSVVLAVVERGRNPPVSIPMVPSSGQVPLSVQIGPVSMTVSPATATLSPGQTLQLTATITAAGGEPVAGPAEWATANPTVAMVDANGLVTALSVGTVEIVATYAGVGTVSTVTVTGPTNTYRVGGSISGLTGTGLELATAGEPNLTVAAGASSFAFASALPSGTSYGVSVVQQPASPSQTCVVTNGSGTVGSADVTSVVVTCTTNTIIDTLPPNCSLATLGALAQGGTFVASGTNLAEFTIRVTMGIEAAARPIILGTTESGAPTLGPVLWEGPDVITPLYADVTYSPNVKVTSGKRYFIGLDYGFLTSVAGSTILVGCRSDNPIPDGQAWRAFSSGWEPFSPGVDIAARIVMY